MSRQLCRSALHALVWLHFAAVRSQGPEQQLASVWPRLRDSRLAAYLASRYGHRCQFDRHELLMTLCVSYIRRTHPGFALPLRIENLPPALQSTSPPLGAICISTHAGHASAVSTLLKLGHPACLLVDAKPDPHAQGLHAVMRQRHPDLKLIPNDRLSLARVARELDNGNSVCCAVDYQDRERKIYCYISLALFELAKRSGRPMFFGRHCVDPTGSSVLAVEGPHFVTDARASAQRFVDFINEGRSQPRTLSVGTH